MLLIVYWKVSQEVTILTHLMTILPKIVLMTTLPQIILLNQVCLIIVKTGKIMTLGLENDNLFTSRLRNLMNHIIYLYFAEHTFVAHFDFDSSAFSLQLSFISYKKKISPNGGRDVIIYATDHA